MSQADPTGWSASGLKDPAAMDDKDDDPTTGSPSGSGGDGGQCRSLCSENAFACGRNDTSGLEKEIKGLLILGQDREEAAGEVEAGLASGSNEQARQRGDLFKGPVDRVRGAIGRVEHHDNLAERRGESWLRSGCFGSPHGAALHELAHARTGSMDSVVGNGRLLIVGVASQLASDDSFGGLRSRARRAEQALTIGLLRLGLKDRGCGDRSHRRHRDELGLGTMMEAVAAGRAGAPATGGATVEISKEAVLVGGGLSDHGVRVIGSRLEQGLQDVPNDHLAKSARSEELPRGRSHRRETRYVKNGRTIDLAPDGSIISFGVQEWRSQE